MRVPQSLFDGIVTDYENAINVSRYDIVYFELDDKYLTYLELTVDSEARFLGNSLWDVSGMDWLQFYCIADDPQLPVKVYGIKRTRHEKFI